MTVFRKVLVKERKPQTDTPVIGGWDHDQTGSIVVEMHDNGYWFLSNKELGPADCDEPDWWLEEIETPTHQEVIVEANRQAPAPAGDVYSAGYNEGFRRCGEWILNRIKYKIP
ncbi:hypothetical protein [Parapedobacter soli]|uniref:hypothetical protein n=1 Tax=Parapedobacter soli TaxID=416955 RepID=UPI0021C76235|nr:hypothetical protein [Parapedobacter soli]